MKGGSVVDELLQMVKAIGIPFAYDHFAEGESPDPPFLCFLTANSDNFSVDGKVYMKIMEVHLELYTDKKNPEAERKVEDVLDDHALFYDKTETWIDTEKLYEVLYTFEMEA